MKEEEKEHNDEPVSKFEVYLRDFRGERAKGEGGVGEEVGPEGEDEEGGEGAQRRACE